MSFCTFSLLLASLPCEILPYFQLLLNIKQWVLPFSSLHHRHLFDPVKTTNKSFSYLTKNTPPGGEHVGEPNCSQISRRWKQIFSSQSVALNLHLFLLMVFSLLLKFLLFLYLFLLALEIVDSTSLKVLNIFLQFRTL